MNSSTITTASATPDQTDRARAASIHSGDCSALERFAATGELDRQNALAELNLVRLPFEREGWVDALGRHILLARGGRS